MPRISLVRLETFRLYFGLFELEPCGTGQDGSCRREALGIQTQATDVKTPRLCNQNKHLQRANVGPLASQHQVLGTVIVSLSRSAES